MEGQVEFCEQGKRCAVCPFRLFHDETVRLAVGTVVGKVLADSRRESNSRPSRLVKARYTLKDMGIARPDSRQMNFLADAAEAIVVHQTCSSYDGNGLRPTEQPNEGQ